MNYRISSENIYIFTTCIYSYYVYSYVRLANGPERGRGQERGGTTTSQWQTPITNY